MFPAGSCHLVRYHLPPVGALAAPRVFHERIVLQSNTAGGAVILTPDGDAYVEELTPSVDVAEVIPTRGQGSNVFAVDEGEMYRFLAIPTDAEMWRFRRAGVLAAGAAMTAEPINLVLGQYNVIGLDPGVYPVVDPGAVPAAGAAAGAGTHAWVYVETLYPTDVNAARVPVRRRGDERTLDGSEVFRNDIGFATVEGIDMCIRRIPRRDLEELRGAEAAEDSRIVALQVGGSSSSSASAAPSTGCRTRRPWREVVPKLSETTYPDWPIAGPRTVGWCSRFLDKRGGGPLDYHRIWQQTHNLEKHNWGVETRELILRALDVAGSYDGVEIANLAWFEGLMRQAQLIEYTYHQESASGGKSGGKGKAKASTRAGVLEEAAIFSGSHRDSGELMCAPDLLDFVAKEVERDAGVLKQIRKAREERQQLSKSQKTEDV